MKCIILKKKLSTTTYQGKFNSLLKFLNDQILMQSAVKICIKMGGKLHECCTYVC